MRIPLFFLSLFIVGLLSFNAPEQAHACSCAMPRSTQESIDTTDVIFSGTVEDVRMSGEWEFEVSMTVDEDWKGLETSERGELTVYTAKDSAACGYAFEEGEEYLVYGYRDEESGEVSVGLCSATKPLDQAEEDLALLSDDEPRACTMDAKACPDGSYVGRDPENDCAWHRCPGEVQACTKELKICPDGTGVGRTGPHCAFAPCPGAEPNCAPYVCANGKTHPRCSEDGTVINYFAPPCHTDGGEEGAPFEDVQSTHANADAIFYVKAEGIVEGYADGTFKADAAINRAEFVKILVGTMELSSAESSACFDFSPAFETGAMDPFLDVSLGEWFSPYVCVARSRHVIGGYPDGSFRPAASINFVEAAKILSNAYGLLAATTIPACEGDCPWYRDHVIALEARAAIPTSIESFDQKITRGEMAEMIYRLKANNNDKPSKTYEELAAGNETAVFRNDEFPVTFSYPARWSDEVTSDSSATWYVNLGPTCRGCAEGGDTETMYVRATDRNDALDRIADIRKQSQDPMMFTTIEHDVNAGGNRVFVWSSGGICGFRQGYVIGERFAVALGGFCVDDDPALSAALDAIALSIRENPTFFVWRD